jgi:hypothetical protein
MRSKGQRPVVPLPTLELEKNAPGEQGRFLDANGRNAWKLAVAEPYSKLFFPVPDPV